MTHKEELLAAGEGNKMATQRHFIAEATSPVRSEIKEQEQKPTTQAHGWSPGFYFKKSISPGGELIPGFLKGLQIWAQAT